MRPQSVVLRLVAVILLHAVACQAVAQTHTGQLFIATSDHRIVRTDEWRQQEVRYRCSGTPHGIGYLLTNSDVVATYTPLDYQLRNQCARHRR